MVSADYVTKVLATLGYASNELLALQIEGSTQTAFAIEARPGEVLDLWAEFRTLFKETGMWPVAYLLAGNPKPTWREEVIDSNIFTRSPYRWERNDKGKDVSPGKIISRSKAMSNAEIIRDYDAGCVEYMDVKFELEQTGSFFGACPDIQEANRIFRRRKSAIAFEKWLLKWERANYPETPSVHPGYIEWHDPGSQRQALILVPVAEQSDILAYIHWYGAETIGSEVVIFQLRDWGKRYGAELVAHYGTMLQFNVARQPKDIWEAFDLAVEQVALAPCTLALPGVSIREHARCLLNAKQWFLHERP